MPNATTRVIAPALPNRRLALATLAGAGTALMLPRRARAAAILDTGADAALIAQAAKVEALARREQLALNRRCAIEGVVDDLHPKYPRKRLSVDTAEPRMEESADGWRVMYVPPLSAYADANAAAAEHAAAVEACEAERVAIDEHHGLPAARKLYDRIDQRLTNAAAQLEDMAPTTLPGAMAKARACVAMLKPYQHDETPEWLSYLLHSALRDVVAIGGAA